MKVFFIFTIFIFTSSSFGKLDPLRLKVLAAKLKSKAASQINLTKVTDKANKLISKDFRLAMNRNRKLGDILSLPSRCSMKTKKGRYSDIMKSLKALTAKIKTGNCKSEGSTYIGQMDRVFQDWEKMSKTTEATQVLGGATPPPPAGTDPAKDASVASDIYLTQARVMAVSTVLKNFGNLAQKAGCQYELKKTDTLEIVRDVISNISSVGLLVPGQFGALTALGGTGLVGVIEMIRNLISTKWDWHSEGDRDTFVDLNCGFFVLQNELEKETLFSVKTTKNSDDQKRLEKEIKDFKKMAIELRAGIHQAEKNSKRFEETGRRIFITKNFSEETYFLLNTIKNVGKVTHEMAPKAKNIPQKGAVLEELLHLYKEFFKYIDKTKVSYYGQFLVPETKENFLKIFGTKSVGPQIKKHEVLTKFLTKKEAYNKLISSFSDPIFWLTDDIEREIEKLPGHKQAINPKVRDAEKALGKLEKRLNYKEKQYERVKGIQTGKFEFDMEDSGTMDRINLKGKYNEIQNVIFGKAGASFLEHTVKHSYNALSAFKHHYKTTFPGYDPENAKLNLSVSQTNMRETCANTDKLMKDYTEGDDLVQAGFDFLVINERHFLRTPDKKNIWDTFKIDYYKKKFLYNNFKEAQKINKLLKTGVIFNEKSYSRSGIARQMIKRSKYLPARIQVQKFHDKSCRRF